MPAEEDNSNSAADAVAKPPESIPAWEDPALRGFVQIRDVRKEFGGIAAVDGVTLDIARGELFTLLGGSGCGKTTLLRMLAGFEQPDSGAIFIDGADMSGVPPYQRPVNMMFQSYALFPHMTVENNIAYGLRRDNTAKAEIRSRVADMLNLVQLSPFAGRRPHQLSGGQRQRVALARALIKNPKLLLLDEPLAALDKKLREQTQFELMNIQDSLGVTFVVVTHDQEEAMVLSTRMAVMHRGKIAQVGEPTSVYEHPESMYVADFVGSTNLLSGRMENGGFVCEELNQTLRVPPLSAAAAAHIAVRPEKITIGREKPADEDRNIVTGTVLDLAYMGGTSIYRVKTASGYLLKVAAPNSRSIGRHAISWDDAVFVSWHAGDSVVLPD